VEESIYKQLGVSEQAPVLDRGSDLFEPERYSRMSAVVYMSDGNCRYRVTEDIGSISLVSAMHDISLPWSQSEQGKTKRAGG